MARDNSPWERQRKQLERKLNRCASYDRILIVSEGSKTEPKYFMEIRAAHRLQTANVEVQPSELGTSSIQVVKYAYPSPAFPTASAGSCVTSAARPPPWKTPRPPSAP
jgi:hypothetical protein